jgi:hypothetical protein
LLAQRVEHKSAAFCRDSEREAALAGALRGVGAIKARVEQRWPSGLHVNPLD